MGPSEQMDRNALVIVLIGASAVGKSSIASRLCDNGITEATPTWATRPPRDGERSTSYDHKFVSDEAFDRQSRIGGFIDERPLYGFRYGLPFLAAPPEGKEALTVLKPVFIPKFIAHFPAARIYQIEASFDVVEDRMKARGQAREDIDRRLQVYESEAAEARSMADVVINNDGPLEQTVDQVRAQIVLDRHMYDGQTGAATPLPVS